MDNTSDSLRFGHLFNGVFWISIDHFWLLFRCNLLSLLLSLPVVTMPLGIAGTLAVCYKLFRKQPVTLTDYWIGMKQFGRKVSLWVFALIGLTGWCLISFLFYVVQGPLMGAMGCTLTVILALGIHVLGYLCIPQIVERTHLKTILGSALRCFLQYPGKVLGAILGTVALKCVLLISGVGILVYGWTWPVACTVLFWREVQNLRDGKDPYQEDRGLKDFLVPRVK